jgi:hypothetical protein
MTNRLHHCVAYGTDTSACDECYGYEAEAYDEPAAEYLDPDRAREDRDERLALERTP